jgi:hypothetical protein
VLQNSATIIVVFKYIVRFSMRFPRLMEQSKRRYGFGSITLKF